MGSSRLYWTPFALWEQARRAGVRARDGLALRLVRFAPPATGFVLQPEPRLNGHPARGTQLLAGNHLVAGRVIERGGTPLWELDAPMLAAELHGFGWLDDLAMIDTGEARAASQEWLFDWIERFDRGVGPGWEVDLTGRRIVRWVHHAILILTRQPPERSRAFFRSLGRQARFLERRWHSARPGLPRIEALTGLVYAGLALEGLGHVRHPALQALGRECARQVAGDGGMASRSPEALTEAFIALSWVNLAVSQAGHSLPPDILRALDRMAPAIRALRLGDGQLARFHGGGEGLPERIDQALADSGNRTPARPEGAMGFARLSAGGTLVILDAGRLPPPGQSDQAHASTLAFEMASGRQTVLANMGPALHFGPEVRRAARASAAHSTVVVDRLSSSRFIADGIVGRTFGQRLIAGPTRVTCERDHNEHGVALQAEHDGYRRAFGLLHERQIAILHGGGEVQGRDVLYCAGANDNERLRAAVERSAHGHLGIRLHFRAHPDVDLSLDLGGRAASLKLPNGETWLLRAPGVELSLQAASYLERGRLRPRATKQVVATLRMTDYEGVVNWTLTRAG